MKLYRLITSRKWEELQKEYQPSKLTPYGFSSTFKTPNQYDKYSLVKFDYTNKINEVVKYCTNNQDLCLELYETLSTLGLYQGRNTYNNDDIKFTKALTEAINSGRAILIEKDVDVGSGMFQATGRFLKIPNYTEARKLTPEEVAIKKAEELAFYSGDEQNWIEFSIEDAANMPFTLFNNSSQKFIMSGKLDNNGHAYVKLEPGIKLVDVLFGKTERELRSWYTDVPLQLLGGARDAGQNILDLMGDYTQAKTQLNRADDYFNPFQVLFSYFFSDDKDLAETIKKQNATVNANLDKFSNKIILPEVDAPETMTGALTRGITQFLVGYITAYRIIKPIKNMGNLLKGAVAGVFADSVVMSPNEERLSNLIEEFPELQNPITDYLKADPDDSEAEGRLKNAIEGLATGLVFEPFVRSLRLLKYARIKFPIKGVRTKVHHELESKLIDNKYTGASIYDTATIADYHKLEKESAEIYNKIRFSDNSDALRISQNTNFPLYRIERIKNHVFKNEHILYDGKIGLFDPDMDMAIAWERLQTSKFKPSDIDLLNHEYFESKFEKLFRVDYSTAHKKAIASGRIWEP